MLKPGTWYLESKLDPRWNCRGRAELVGMFTCPPEAEEKIEELKKTLGDPPADLRWGYWKD